jgi:hypothetical protein
MYTKSILLVMLVGVMASMQACSLGEPIRHWNDQVAQINDPKDVQAETTNTFCVSNGNHCAGCGANKDDCRNTVRTTLFVWNAAQANE